MNHPVSQRSRKKLLTLVVLCTITLASCISFVSIVAPVEADGLFSPQLNRLQSLTAYVKTHAYGEEGEIALSPDTLIPSFEGSFFALATFETITAPLIDPSINMSFYYRWVSSNHITTTFAPGYGGFSFNVGSPATLIDTYYGTKTLALSDQLHRINKTALGVWVNQVQVNGTPTWGWTNTSQPSVVTTSFVIEILDAADALGSIPDQNALISWILDCQDPTGGFGIRANDTTPSLMDTYYAITALQRLDALDSVNVSSVRDFVLTYQLPDGGFASVGDDPDLASTFWAIETLQVVSDLSDVHSTSLISNWIISLQQPNGGFSRFTNETNTYLASTFYSVHILYSLGITADLANIPPWEVVGLDVTELVVIAAVIIVVISVIYLIKRIQKLD